MSQSSTLLEVIRALGTLARIAQEVAPLLDGSRDESDVRQLLKQVVAMSSGKNIDLRSHIARAQQAITAAHGHQTAAELAAALELAVLRGGPGTTLAALRGVRQRAGDDNA